ncbi:MAG: hypothetical protein IKH57_08300 [Clostridia bacterium]|nr:hypothetical protein [Clostridia bacterium]MBR6028385.1 hypothetical protein [Clostridia bacterium]
MKKNHGYEIDYTKNTVTVTKKFLKEAGIIGSAAYTELAQVHRDHPDFQIVQREITKKQGKKTYGKLTYEVMADFIAVKEEENAPAVLVEFERVKALSKVQAGQYAFVKTWFLNRYSNEFQQEETEDAAA